jgi:hypothetical protein
MLSKKAAYAALLTVCMIAACGNAALAGKRVRLASLTQRSDYSTSALSIESDKGGVVVQYGLRMLGWRQNGTKIRFSGSCQSACTLYLGLAPSQMCISPGASFSFHSPSGASSRGNRMAQAFMMQNYPAWVKSWIRSQGGLSGQLKTMSYSYASRHIKPCGSFAAAKQNRS